jgi:hypothetical protein
MDIEWDVAISRRQFIKSSSAHLLYPHQYTEAVVVLHLSIKFFYYSPSNK